jgi:hypothetical protein
VSPDPRRARPTAPACADYFCYTWRAGGTVKIEVVSLKLSDAEMKKILLGVKIVSIGDKDKRTEAASAFPVRP